MLNDNNNNNNNNKGKETTLSAAFAKASAKKAGAAIIDAAIKATPTFTATGKARDGKPVLVDLADLHLDLSYQFNPKTEPGRQASLKHWMSKKGGFDPVEGGPIHVNCRAAGDYNGVRMRGGELYNMDGGGRADMAAQSGLSQILAIVTEGKTWQEEVDFFIDKNRHSRRITPPHLFIVAANGGHEPEATIMKYVKQAKYVVERNQGKGAVIATSALWFAFRLGETVLEMALLDMRAIWGDDEVDGRHLVALAVIRALYPHLDQRKLRDCLRDYEGGSADCLINEARGLAFKKVSKTRNPQSRDTNPWIVKTIMELYNYRKGYKAGLRMEPIFTGLRAMFGNQNEYWGVWSFTGDRAPRKNKN